jgi:hypothetical protein
MILAKLLPTNVPPWSWTHRIGRGYRDKQLFSSCIPTCWADLLVNRAISKGFVTGSMIVGTEPESISVNAEAPRTNAVVVDLVYHSGICCDCIQNVAVGGRVMFDY